MIRHLLKLVWHRKRANALVAVEIFFSFLVIFAVVTGGIALFSGWRQPLGYEWKNVWMISIGGGPDDVMATGDDPMRETIARVLQEAKTFPQVAGAGLSSMPPLSGMISEGVWSVGGRRFNIDFLGMGRRLS